MNYITFGGTYANQPQPNTRWEVSYNNGIVLKEGTGGWLDSGILELKLDKPISASSIKVEVFNSKSIHLRGRGGFTEIEDDRSTKPKATLIQYLPSAVTGDIIELSDTYKLYQDNKLIFEYLNAEKVKDSASNVKKQFPLSVVKVTQPDEIYKLGEGGKVIATIDVIYHSVKRAIVLNSISDKAGLINFGGDCDNGNYVLLISEKPFDFKDRSVNLYNAEWIFRQGLLNNGEFINEKEAEDLGLIIRHCD